ncbi:NAD(P)/FAD-dependent oxidoreductase [Jeongeupia chitinilytica]|uniref:NAD/FAD-binding protein n=1 Tax=Jeongeupia chitinilytica TaxID=1041641 RepID=A0ABQ3H0I7_9NEIS|nr:FAD-dependent oxidoreductase [Jeongeupia chitinilytica]GHD64281.1 NAD/FAD-binding protein [Jeongeupia chitinilytica]
MTTDTSTQQRIAIIGAGIAGLASAYLLSRRHTVTLYESGDYLGGHTNTVDVSLDGLSHPVDTGFLVFNDRTYPNLIALFDELGVASHATGMTFAVSVDDGRLEWAGSNLNTVFAQRRNLLSPQFVGMLRDILRFNAAAQAGLDAAIESRITLAQLLEQGRYGRAFRDAYLLPMAAAIWSSAPGDILRFPATTFLRFCLNHALLQVNDRPQWRSVIGGGRDYVRRIAATLNDVRLRTPVYGVQRHDGRVLVRTDDGVEAFDAVVFATHAPDTLKLLDDAGDDERRVLGAVRYQPNTAVLHTDTGQLPRRQSVWSAWNCLARTGDDGNRPVCVSYLLNRLQPLPFTRPVIVTLNPHTEPDPARVLARFEYDHPLLDQPAIDAQAKLAQLQGRRRSWYAGAWTGYGFHEDGLKSALRVADAFGVLPAWAVR